MSRILVIGKSGTLATALREAAPPAGFALTALGRDQCNLRDRGAVAAALDKVWPAVVINAAAYTDVDGAEHDRDAAFALNADGPGTLAAICRERGIPLLHISTDYVFDGTKGAPYTEGDMTNPINIYGESKLSGEGAVAAALEEHVIVRTAWLYGPVGRSFVAAILERARAGAAVRVVEDQFGSPTYAPHLAPIVLAIAAQMTTAGFVGWGLYHAAGSGHASRLALAREALSQAAASGWPDCELTPIPASEFPAAAVRPADTRLDTTAMESVFGLALPHWSLGVADFVDRLSATASGQRSLAR